MPSREERCPHEATFYELAEHGEGFLIRCASCGLAGPIGDVREAHEGWEELHGGRHKPEEGSPPHVSPSVLVSQPI